MYSVLADPSAASATTSLVDLAKSIATKIKNETLVVGAPIKSAHHGSSLSPLSYGHEIEMVAGAAVI
jgi:hypothetical protein